MGPATTLLRVVTGATLVNHGLQKLTGSPGAGPPDSGTNAGGAGPEPVIAAEMVDSGGDGQFSIFTGAMEVAGGAMMLTGLSIPFACSMVSAAMLVEVARDQRQHGLWPSNRRYEAQLHILAATFALAREGGGALTLDGLRHKRRRGPAWAVLQLVVGAAAAAQVLAMARRQQMAGTEVSPGELEDQHLNGSGALGRPEKAAISKPDEPGAAGPSA
jgi:putative oxidoreductase